MNELIDQFLDQTNYKELSTVEGSKGKCDGVAVELKQFLTQNNIKADIIEGIGYLPELHQTAHDDWQSFRGKDQKFLAHVVVKVNNMILDLTGAQFNQENAARMLYPFDTFKKEWKQIKTPKHLNK